MDINQRSRIFVEVASKLALLSSAKRMGKGSFTLSELKEKSKNMDNSCLLVKLKDIKGYMLLCDGEVVAAAFQEPPALGDRALALIGEDPLRVELYEVPKESVKEAEEKLELSNEAQEVGKKVSEMLSRLSAKKKGTGKKEETTLRMPEELPESVEVAVPPLEILELIDLVTMSDELAYYLEREGVNAESDTPESINNVYVAKIRLKTPLDVQELIPKLYMAAKRSETNSIIEVLTPEGKAYFFDPLLHEGIREILRRFRVYDEPTTYLEISNNKAVVYVILGTTLPPQYASRIVASMVNLIKRRKLPLKNIELRVKAGSMNIVGEVI